MLTRISPITIEGRHNPLVKELRRAARSGELLSGGLVLLETARLIQDALDSGIRIEKVLISRGNARRTRDLIGKLPAGTAVYEVPSNVFETLTSTETSPGVLALARSPQWDERDLLTGAALLVVVAGVQDPGNLGAIIRAAEAFGATGMLLSQGTVSPYNAKAIRAAAGSLLRLPMLRELSVKEITALLSRHGVRLFTAVAEGGQPICSMDFAGPAAIAVGSEGAGLPKELAAAGEKFTIPIVPTAESLNVAAATAVALYEIARQRAGSQRATEMKPEARRKKPEERQTA